jgi:phosphoglycolate phosphatase-like HAD superfamily hydrolase
VRLVLFDIDGTLLFGRGVGARAMTRAGRLLLGERFTLDGIDFGGALDPWIFRQAAERFGHTDPGSLHAAFHDAYLVELARELEAPELRPVILPGVARALEVLRGRRGLTLGLVTGNYRRAAPLKLGAVGIDPARFTLGAFGDEAPTRPELVRLALERWAESGASPDPRRAVVIGDTPRDVDCAQKNGCRCLAVATGAHSVKALASAGADAVVPDLTDLTVLESWLAD